MTFPRWLGNQAIYYMESGSIIKKKREGEREEGGVRETGWNGNHRGTQVKL